MYSPMYSKLYDAMRSAVSSDGYPVMYWTPLDLFGLVSQGFWYDPSDLSTLFQDATGTTPVTAVGQPVGLMLDKSRGLLRGGEMRTLADTGLVGTATPATYNPSTGVGSLTRIDPANQSFIVVNGLIPGAAYMVDLITSAVLSIRAESQAASVALTLTPGAGSGLALAGSGGRLYITAQAAGSVNITGLSVRELPGHHQSINVPASRPILRQNATTGAYYLETGGADDYMVSTPVDFTSTDKVSLFVGIRKLSDAARGMLLELGIIEPSGSFQIEAPAGASPSVAFVTKGSLLSSATTTSYPAPLSAVLSAFGDISGDVASLRINSQQVAQSAADQGTGNYGNHALYLFRRGGTTLPWAGHFYGLVGIGRLATATEVALTERWLARKVGVTL